MCGIIMASPFMGMNVGMDNKRWRRMLPPIIGIFESHEILTVSGGSETMSAMNRQISTRRSSPPHDFLVELYDKLNDAPMQQKFRRLAPMPVGCVFLPWPGMTEDDARRHFRLMKALGFNCLKQTMPTVEWPRQRTQLLALEEGIVPYWYGTAGYEDVTPSLLQQLGLPVDMDVDEALEHPAVIAHQHAVIRKRIEQNFPDAGPKIQPPEAAAKNKDWVPSVVGDIKGHELNAAVIPDFVAWLKKRYGTVDALREAWNVRHVGIGGEGRMQWKTWDDVAEAWRNGYRSTEYRHITDALRFRAETFVEVFISGNVRTMQKTDPHTPIRAGGEMGLFLPFASRGTDMEAVAGAVAAGGSFYPSIHLAWHFEEVDFEVARPVYMQAQIAADWGKGMWTATWESTGGPQYFSGGKAPFVKEAQDKQPGFTVDEGTITQLMLSYLAAGFKGFGLWAWNYRTCGWEGGEYALLDRNLNPTARAFRAGQIGHTANRYRRELWQAHKEPLVGVLADWDNEATWAAMSVQGRDFYKFIPIRARIGVSRALMNANVPWEYVTVRNLRAGLAPRYKVIYMPASLSISTELQQLLLDYVKQGGRVVMDMPGAYYDEFSRIFPTNKGSAFEKIFGVELAEFSYSNPLNIPYTLDGTELGESFTCVLNPTTARVVARYKHSGAPGITENRVGKGTAVILGCQASLNCCKPGNAKLERLLVKHTLGTLKPPYACKDALVYRLAAPHADHYFLINDGPSRKVTLNTGPVRYRSVTDALTGRRLKPGTPILLEGYSGRWLRCAKQ
jgi:beta-galactosidase